MRVVWKKVIMPNLVGKQICISPLGACEFNADTMLEQIRNMEGIPISFQSAVALFFEDLYEAFEDPDLNSFEIEEIGLARWIGAKGYKIVLTGSEYMIEN